MSTTPVVTLATWSGAPELSDDERELPAALRARGIDVRVRVWDDPTVDWSEAGLVVVRGVRDYAQKLDQFLTWTKSLHRVLNHPDVMEWNTDKHYLLELEKRGMPIIPTQWLEPDVGYSKHQIHTRMPADGDFVVKPAVSSGGRGTGRYTSTDAASRQEAILHVDRQLRKGRTVMVQRYLDQIDREGEISLIYFNGLSEHMVVKEPMLHPSFRSVDDVHEEVASSREASEEEWRWGERIRRAIHGYIKDRLGRDEQLLYCRVDLVRDGKGGFYVMEISLIDGSLYLGAVDDGLEAFADAIAVRAFW
ncbi:ATP-grasp domain-containing protein [Georgenia sp. Z1491]|uniref:ATP-grasp domain-containing protein n=1 Tax=Georgenia sp. Z1491 TaxID=3416707 RepID=UPI003CF73868